MKYQITHLTRYQYEEPVSVCRNEVCLHPRDTRWQTVDSHELDVNPDASDYTEERQDYFGNTVSGFNFISGYRTLEILSRNEVLLQPRQLPPVNQSPPWEKIRDTILQAQTPEQIKAAQFRFPSARVPLSQAFGNYARTSFTPNRPILEALENLTARIFDEFEFDPKATVLSTPVEQVFEQRRGVCQDFAHLQLSILRSLGLPARYVSGYLRTYTAPGKVRLAGSDASHAWISLYCGELGWVDTDPTNNQFPSLDHITIGWGRDYNDVCPVKGVFVGGGSSRMKVEVDVIPVEDFPAA